MVMGFYAKFLLLPGGYIRFIPISELQDGAFERR